MGKSMYSLILMDEVVSRIDEAAYRRGLSRSAMINQVLADYVSLTTPQKRIEEIFGHLSKRAEGGSALQVQQASNTMLLLKSVLNYRYNPTIRYSVEFAQDEDSYRCEFRVVSRTQSDALLNRLTVFYELWCQIERYMYRETPGVEIRAAISGGRFKRNLLVEQDGAIRDSQALGDAIGAYIRLFDQALKLSFGAEGGVDMETFEAITNLYQEYLDNSQLIV